MLRWDFWWRLLFLWLSELLHLCVSQSAATEGLPPICKINLLYMICLPMYPGKKRKKISSFSDAYIIVLCLFLNFNYYSEHCFVIKTMVQDYKLLADFYSKYCPVIERAALFIFIMVCWLAILDKQLECPGLLLVEVWSGNHQVIFVRFLM